MSLIDPEKRRAYQREYQRRNPEKVNRWARRYRASRPEWVREQNQKAYNKPGAKEKRTTYKRKYISDPRRRLQVIVTSIISRCRKTEIEVDQGALQGLINELPTHCPCCKHLIDYEPPAIDPRLDRRASRAPSIDRVNNSKGYVVGNVQVTCVACNIGKSNLTPESAKMFLHYMESYWPKEAVSP